VPINWLAFFASGSLPSFWRKSEDQKIGVAFLASIQTLTNALSERQYIWLGGTETQSKQA
jgi:hypothetical protein